jgi:putative toxin-antitoxin system antitoxin component (TIGR02293 family)
LNQLDLEMTVHPQRIAHYLGGRELRRIRTATQLRKAVEAGLPVKSLEDLARYMAGSKRAATELKHQIVPKTTLQRRTRLTPHESERLERFARMVALAEQVWEDRALAREFLTSPQPQLDGERPVDLSRSDLGTRQVEDLLLKLEYALPV